MSINIEHSRVIQFKDVIEQVARQMASNLRRGVKEERVTGKSLTVERLNNPNDTLGVIASRHADTSISDLEHSRRVINMVSYARAYMIDDEDKVRMLADPTSDYVLQIAGEFNRTIDDKLIEAALGNALSDETGSTTVALPAGQQIAHGSAGLTLDKLKEAQKILMANDVDIDREDLFLAVNAEGYEDLLKDAGVVSRDFVVDTRTNPDGALPVRLAGFNIIHSERLTSYTGTSASSSDRPALAFARSGIRLGVGMDMNIMVDRRADKNNNFQVLLKTTFGAGRVHDEKVVDIRFQE